MSYSQVFKESQFYSISLLSEFDSNFLTSKFLITISNDTFQSNFVGEVVTPENSFFSVPKNFDTDKSTINLMIKVLDTFRYLKKDGKTLLLNDEFTSSSVGSIKSEKFYFNELKEFFLDFITYEFIYPKQTIDKHSTSPLKGKIDVLKTIRARKQKGPGITYKTKDVKNSDNWNIDDVYWTGIKYLTDKWGNDDDKEQVYEMKEFLLEEGYLISELDINDTEKMISEIEKSDVGIIHLPIKNTLLDYFKSIPISEKFKVKVFYTKYFQYVWEEIIRISLYNSSDFEKELINKFKNIETQSKWISSSKIDDFLKNNLNAKISNDNPNIVEWDEKNLRPDLFSEIKTKEGRIRFIGDAKYYNDINSEYGKEMNEYNDAMNNIYPMCIFVPSNITTVFRTKRVSDKELIIFKLDIKKVIEDSINRINGRNTFETIDKVLVLINKYTRRRNKENGFDTYK